MAGDVTITIEGVAYDLEDFSLGDLEWPEEHIGGPLFDEQNLTSMKAMVGFVYLVKRRALVDFTLEDARKVKLASLDANETTTVTGDPDADPTPPPPASTRKRSRAASA